MNQTREAALQRRGCMYWIFAALVGVLFLATLWSAWQLMTLINSRTVAQADLRARQQAYEATADALRRETESGWNAGITLAQFVTNTPAAEVAPSVTQIPLPTSTIPAVDVTATPFVAPTFFPAAQPDVLEIAGTAVPSPVPAIPREYELVNILLLGSDDEVSEDGSIRTDTMIIVSVNTETRSVAMLSLPRDLFVYIPTPTMTRLNTVYGIGESFGWDGGGFGLLRQVIFYNFGINVHYYARVNFSGFETLIDTLGGIEVAVDCEYTDYYPVEDFDPAKPIEENYALRTLPIGYYTMNGFDALWYARTRKVSDDFDRGRRQQQILRAIFRKALNSGQLANLPTLWAEVTQVVDTDIPFEVMLGLLPIGLQLDPIEIENFVFIRTYHTTPWQPPSGPFAGQAVQLPVYEPMRELLTDFYQPPTESQVALQGARIAVYNGTSNADWDKVAAERLRWDGLNAYSAGAADRSDYAETSILDETGESKGSPLPAIIDALNASPANVQVQPNPNRQADFTVVLGAAYSSCDVTLAPINP